MKYKYIIWDWNGTLYNDVENSILTINQLLAENGYEKRLDFDSYQEVFGFPIIDYYRRVGFDFDRHPFDILAERYTYINVLNEGISSLADGAREALEAVESLGLSQNVISVCEEKRLLSQLESYNIRQYFDSVLGTHDNFAYGKEQLASDWIESRGISPDEVLFIGDTEHDREVADIVGCDCVLVSCGHQAHEKLAATGCPVFGSLHGVTEYLTQNA